MPIPAQNSPSHATGVLRAPTRAPINVQPHVNVEFRRSLRWATLSGRAASHPVVLVQRTWSGTSRACEAPRRPIRRSRSRARSRLPNSRSVRQPYTGATPPMCPLPRCAHLLPVPSKNPAALVRRKRW